tara:strand:- start:5022 stop:5963 length:942 start_codon:yes stop_codon:yes gene_type:complete
LKKVKKIISVQADPVEKINVNTDTTYLLLLEAQKRGYQIFWYETKGLSLINKKVTASGNFVTLFKNKRNYFKKKQLTQIDLSRSKYLLIRQNPPFNMDYINSTLYLEKLKKSVKVINNPSAIRNISEKFYSSKFIKYMPPTIFTRDISKIYNFYIKYKKIVIKPTNGYAGKQILFLDKNFNKKKISDYLKKIGHVMVQKFLPAVKYGDKRIFIINGKVMGAIKRVPSRNSILSNISQGGKAVKTILNLKERNIAKFIGKDLIKNNIYFSGIDLVSGYLIGDINITSPTGLPQFKELTGINLAINFWDNTKYLK